MTRPHLVPLLRGTPGTRRAGRLLLAAAVAAGVLAVPGTADALGCGFLGLGSCPPAASNPAQRTPGTPVTPLKQVNRSTDGGTNPRVGSTPLTTTLGVPDAGVVPVVGKVSAVADDGAYVAYESRLDARTLDLMIVSPALGGAAPVRLLLPAGYTSKAAWPALYLLHGANDKTDYQSWTYDTQVASFTAKVPALVVMPSLGSSAYGTNYWNYGFGGGNQYDTFLATELPQLLQRGYRASTRAVVGGISTGGYAALALAGLHPGEYAAAAGYSGLPDTELPVVAQAIEYGPITQFQSPLAMWGDLILQHGIWDNRNPTRMLSRLRGVRMFVSSGNGNPGPLDPPGAGSDPLEPLTQASTQSFVRTAAAAGVPVTADLYGNGTHSWPYWNREFQRSWPILAAGLGVSAASA